MRRSAGIISLLYGLIVISLGIMGYQQANSLISLIVGGLLGLCVTISSLSISMDKRKGYYFAIFFTFVLGAFFSVRFSVKADFLNGAMALFSIASLVFLSLELYRLTHKS